MMGTSYDEINSSEVTGHFEVALGHLFAVGDDNLTSLAG